MEIEEAAPNPENIAIEIHSQLGERQGSVRVNAIAAALDIIEIRSQILTNFEGALITTPERGYGSILVNELSGPQRQSFTIAHELGHFLNPWHKSFNVTGFKCTRSDLRVGVGSQQALRDLSRYEIQEKEANRFAAELLLPTSRVQAQLTFPPNLESVISIAREFDVSREASARRYIQLQTIPMAIAFSRDGQLRYWETGTLFPETKLQPKDNMPLPSQTGQKTNITEPEETNPANWLAKPTGQIVTAQTLYQQEGYAMTLIVVTQD
ncbi:MAG: ImmA/IrrE family metallo-endopeptidase [Fimbriimonadaceae bacterium]|nr:ImmA/IrrE family metallo-endopeptidase [Alphaproteobacteria bacterium]